MSLIQTIAEQVKKAQENSTKEFLKKLSDRHSERALNINKGKIPVPSIEQSPEIIEFKQNP